MLYGNEKAFWAFIWLEKKSVEFWKSLGIPKSIEGRVVFSVFSKTLSRVETGCGRGSLTSILFVEAHDFGVYGYSVGSLIEPISNEKSSAQCRVTLLGLFCSKEFFRGLFWASYFWKGEREFYWNSSFPFLKWSYGSILISFSCFNFWSIFFGSIVDWAILLKYEECIFLTCFLKALKYLNVLQQTLPLHRYQSVYNVRNLPYLFVVGLHVRIHIRRTVKFFSTNWTGKWLFVRVRPLMSN